MNRAQLRAKAERRKMRQELRERYPQTPLVAEIEYDNWLRWQEWGHYDPKKIVKHSPWIKAIHYGLEKWGVKGTEKKR